MNQLVLDTPLTQLDQLLELVCLELQLTNAQFENARSSYEDVGTWLDKPGSALARYSPRVSAQGSMEIGTANKPRLKEEFDVDSVCRLEIDPKSKKPTEVYQLVLDRLKEHEHYRKILVPKERCIRLEYAGQFHLDVIPACPAPLQGEPFGHLGLVIPDRSCGSWVPTNPHGFGLWFFSMAKPEAQKRIAASVDPLPPNAGLEDKTQLHRIVQLFKRRRDVHFDGDEFAPRSILLTTLDALMWERTTSLDVAIIGILDQLVEWGRRFNGSRPPVVKNPTNSHENLARHWQENHRHFISFIEYVVVFREGMERLRAARGIPATTKILSELFDPGDSGIVKRAMKSYTNRFQQERISGKVGFVRHTPSLVSVASTPRSRPIPRNDFFGDCD